eukprot:SAG22_NODE_2462_length_2544_cov_1.131288_3_plen_132_part_00
MQLLGCLFIAAMLGAKIAAAEPNPGLVWGPLIRVQAAVVSAAYSAAVYVGITVAISSPVISHYYINGPEVRDFPQRHTCSTAQPSNSASRSADNRRRALGATDSGQRRRGCQQSQSELRSMGAGHEWRRRA